MGPESLHFSSPLGDVDVASRLTLFRVVRLYISLRIKIYTQAYTHTKIFFFEEMQGEK